MKTLAIAVVTMLASVLPAAAQSLQGAWSWLSPGQGGMDQNTAQFAPDGSYVRVSRLANGMMLRNWGSYSATPAGPGQVQLQTRTVGWLPGTICAQAPGFPARCSPAPHPPEMAFAVRFTSPDTIVALGTTLQRDASPVLLQQRPPEQVTSLLAAPVQPRMAQPVMPTLHPYVTPNGPGNQMAAANHATAQRFINENMRGCYTGTDGRLYGCQQ